MIRDENFHPFDPKNPKRAFVIECAYCKKLIWNIDAEHECEEMKEK